jgi:propanediol utilization protein
MDIQALTQAVMGKLFVELEASGRHVHVTCQQAQQLFGHDLTPQRPLSQPGQYLARERVTVIGPKGRFENVAVLGPARSSAQVEISLSDGKTLGIQPPVRLSGKTENTPGCLLQGPCGSVELSQEVIAAKRHIHMTPRDAARMGVQDRQTVRLQTYTERPLVFEDVVVRVSPDFATFVHLDYDEANACGMQARDLGRILP